MLQRIVGMIRRPRADPERHVPSIPMNRPLTRDEDAVLRWILHIEDIQGGEELRSQVPHVRVVYGRTTELGLVVDAGARSVIPDGHLPLTAMVVGDAEEPVGHIDVWIKNGWLSMLEYSWFTDEMPLVYPTLDRLRLWDPTVLGPDLDRVTFSGAD